MTTFRQLLSELSRGLGYVMFALAIFGVIYLAVMYGGDEVPNYTPPQKTSTSPK